MRSCLSAASRYNFFSLLSIYNLSLTNSQIKTNSGGFQTFLMSYFFFQEIVAGNTDTPLTSQPSPPCADSNQSYPGDRLGVTKDGISQDSSKTKKPTMQHLLSDWRTAMSSQPKVKQPGSQSMESIERDKKTKTIQHLLCDWRTAYTESKKVILFIFFYI